jgi:THO complex subunit 2
MAPNGKRKRGDRTYSQDSTESSQRPSPHRPQNLTLGQQNQYANNGGGARGGRRGSRGGIRGGSSQQPPRSPVNAPSVQSPSNVASPAPSTAMDPPASKEPLPRASYAAPQSQAPAAPATSPTVTQSGPRPLYKYDYLTDERIQAWRTTGRAGVVELALQLRENEEDIALGMLFNELIMSALRGRLTGEEAGAAVKEIMASLNDFEFMDLPSLFLDNLSILAEAEHQYNLSLVEDKNQKQLVKPDPVLGVILRNSGISASLMRETLDTFLLQGLGFVRQTFNRINIRHSTNTLYRQRGYNLLREETEGYSKLITEYFTVTGTLSPSNEVVVETWEKIKALIGAFDLDVGRVLDVTLDAFANALIKHNRFFIKFLRISCWWPNNIEVHGFEHDDQGFDSLPTWANPGQAGWETTPEDRQRLAELRETRDIKFWDRVREAKIDAFFELGGRRALSTSEMADIVNGDTGEEMAETDREWAAATGTLPPRGNHTAAQLLGFKLRFYASESRDPTDKLPENLIRVAALLIKIGFISFRDLYPHLYPLDKDMGTFKEKLTKENAERRLKEGRGGGGNALTMAGALPDEPERGGMGRMREPESRSTPLRQGITSDATSTPLKVEEETVQLPEPEDQKIHLLRDLLLIGAIPESLYMLGRFPWLLDLYPDLPPYLFRILHHSLDKVYADAHPQPAIPAMKKLAYNSTDASLSKGQLTFIDRPGRRTLKWAHMDRAEFTEADYGIDYKYYWDDWADNVPVCQNVDDVFALCDTLLNLVGVKIGRDPELLMKLTRIGKKSLDQDRLKENTDRWLDLLKRILVPALSLTKANPGVVNEVWEVMKLFPPSARFGIYSDWFTGPLSRQPDLKEAFDQTMAETRDVLKRISKTNTKAMARALAKVAYASPGKVFMVTLNQIESYNNLIEVVVECGRYFTYLGYEVLTWALLNALGGAGRNRMQGDGMLTSPWLKALSTFAGRIYRRYAMMDPAPILQYVAAELRKGRSEDLEVLSEMVDAMAGIRPDTTWSEDQCVAMAGRALLRSQTLKQLGDRRAESRLQSRRLVRSLTGNGLAGQLLVSIAQERQLYPYRDATNEAPIKVLSSNISKLHDDLIQYLDMLRTNLSVKEFDAAVPPIEKLISELGIDANVAWTISRPSIQYYMDEADKADAATKPAKEKSLSISPDRVLVNGDTEMTDSTAKANTTDGPADGIEDITMKEASDPPTAVSNHDSPKGDEALHPVLQDLIHRLESVLPEDFGKTISLPFYVRFWQLTLSDLVVPPYDQEAKRLKAEIDRLKADKQDMSPAAVKKRDADVKRLITVTEDITNEFKEHLQHQTAVKKKIISSGEKDAWLVEFPGRKHEVLVDSLFQELLLPRLLLSPLDALFAAKFIFWVHRLGTPHFRTLSIFMHLFRQNFLDTLITQFTEKEAKNFSVFLNEILMEFRRWIKEATIYEKEAYGPKGKEQPYPGFSLASAPDGMGVPARLVGFEEFRTAFAKWNGLLFHALKSCLQSGDYMRIRNSFQIMKGIHMHFPMINHHGTQLYNEVTLLSTKDPRDDIRLSATSLLGDLKKRQKHWVPFSHVRLVSFSDSSLLADSNMRFQGPGPKQEESPASKPAQLAAPPALNANAPEFKPSATSRYVYYQ